MWFCILLYEDKLLLESFCFISWKARLLEWYEVSIGYGVKHLYQTETSGLTHKCFRVPLKMIVWIYNTFDTNFEI